MFFKRLIQQLTGAPGISADAPVPDKRASIKNTASIDPGEPWADAALGDLSSMDATQRDPWQLLLNHAITARSSKPSGTWLKTAAKLIGAIGSDAFVARLSVWLPLVGKPGPGRPMRGWTTPVLDPTVLSEQNADILKGLVWSMPAVDTPRVAHLLGDLAEICFKKIPVHGARCPRVANACLITLSLMKGPEPVAQLSRIQAKAKKPSARKMIEKAMSSAAAQQGVTPDELEEMSVPDFGLDLAGRRSMQIGDWSADVAIIGTRDVEFRWRKRDLEKTQSSVPADVKRDHADALKELNRIVKDLERILPTQSSRIERLLIDDRVWPIDQWRKRYLDHPLLANIARRLIWQSNGTTFIHRENHFVDADDHSVDLPRDVTIRLWHPISASPDEVLAWRRWLESHEIAQPFKQAHREIYVLTDAERDTRTYSNRFASHIIRQHQFQALCGERGWSYKLMGNFDSADVPTRVLPRQNLKVEFWVEGAQTEQLSEAGIFVHVGTDQVRFYHWEPDTRTPRQRHQDFMEQLRQIRPGHPLEEPQPLPLDQINPRVFSEVMRDVDLFVGVCSVGNDPNWHDRGDDIGGYWQSFSFGDLNETAKTRRDVLSRLLPRLKIADRATLDDRFLLIRGDLRSYKIHLGSSNIQMEPNNQYLCIVPDRSSRGPKDEIFLPFEGDRTLAVILSKAFLLADDKNIKDQTIVNQIKCR